MEVWLICLDCRHILHNQRIVPKGYVKRLMSVISHETRTTFSGNCFCQTPLFQYPVSVNRKGRTTPVRSSEPSWGLPTVFKPLCKDLTYLSLFDFVSPYTNDGGEYIHNQAVDRILFVLITTALSQSRHSFSICYVSIFIKNAGCAIKAVHNNPEEPRHSELFSAGAVIDPISFHYHLGMRVKQAEALRCVFKFCCLPDSSSSKTMTSWLSHFITVVRPGHESRGCNKYFMKG